jgi:hypothetical protein
MVVRVTCVGDAAKSACGAPTGAPTAGRGVRARPGITDRLGSTASMEDRLMSIVVRFNPTNVTSEKYEESLRRIKEAGEWPPAGMDYHVLFGSEGNLRVSEIWDSREQFQAFGERLMPILADIGIEFSGEPEIFEVHNIVKR